MTDKIDVDGLVERLQSPATVFYEYSADDGALLREAETAILTLLARSVKLKAERDEARADAIAYEKGCDSWQTDAAEMSGEASRLAKRLERAEKVIEPFARLDMPDSRKWSCGTFIVEHDAIRAAREFLEGSR